MLKNDGRAIYAEPRIRRAATAWGTFRGKVDPLSDPNPELSAASTLYIMLPVTLNDMVYNLILPFIPH